MKKILLIILSAIALVGCTLEEKIISSSATATYYKSVAQCRTGLNGCYIPLRSFYSSNNYFQVCEVAADIMYHNTTSLYDARAEYTPSQPRYGATMWSNGYLGVMRCNAMYAAIERSPLTDEEKAPLFAECVILRAFYYYLLTINFGDVPFYDEEVTDANNDKIASLPRMPASDIRKKMIEELDYWLSPESGCRKALPLNKTYAPENQYRIGAMVGFMLAGKMCMWEKDWVNAKRFFSYIENVYKEADADGNYDPQYALMNYPVSDIKFRNRYTPESIFELPAYSKDYGLRVVHNLASRCTPMRNSSEAEGDENQDGGVTDDDNEDVDLSVKTDVYNGICIPELGSEARTTSPYRPTRYFSFGLMGPTETQKLDANGGIIYKDYTIARPSSDKRLSTYHPAETAEPTACPLESDVIEDGGGYLAWTYRGWATDEARKEDTAPESAPGVYAHTMFFSSTANLTKTPYLGDKFWCPGMIYNQDSNNLKIFRFAGVLLNLAEVYMRLGDFETACKYLNATKRRANIGVISVNDEDLFMDELQKECARELFGEFNRRHDLVRWGIWHDQIAKYGGSSLQANVAAYPCRQYYPIPDQQIVLSGYALDNKEYEKYGL